MPAKEFVIIQSFLYKPPFIFFLCWGLMDMDKSQNKSHSVWQRQEFSAVFMWREVPKAEGYTANPSPDLTSTPLAVERTELRSLQRHWLLQGQEWHYPRYTPEVWEEGDRAAWCSVWLPHLQGMHCVDMWPHAKSIKPWKIWQVTVIKVWRGGCKSLFLSHGI